MKKTLATATLFATCALTARTALPAHADETSPEKSLPGQSRSTTTEDRICEQARAANSAQGNCSAQETTSTSKAAEISAADLPSRDADLRAADGTRLADVAAVRTIWTRTWSQEMRGLYYINWLEKHTGRIYYDGSRVWSTTSTSGYKGSHTCNQGFGIGYSVKVTKCSTEKIGAGSLREWDYFQVHVIAHNIPIYVSHSMRAAFNGKGSIS